MGTQFKKGNIIELTIDDLAFGAKGIAKLDDFVWFVERGIPGQKVEVKITRLKSNFGEAVIEKEIEPSPHQVDPPCPYFGDCGGCQLQHLDYKIQVETKTRQVKEILERIAGLKEFEIRPTIPSKIIYGYRNKMEFTFSDRRWIPLNEDNKKPNNFALGLHIPRQYNKILDMDACLLQSPEANKLFQDIKKLIIETELEPYNIKTHTGFWRFLAIREGKNTGDIMFSIFTSGQEPEKVRKSIDWMMHKLFWKHLELTTAIHSVTDSLAQVAVGESDRLLLGMGNIMEKIGNNVYAISPNAFFQTNTTQTEKLFDIIVELSNFNKEEIVYDLYCGIGAISSYIANKVKSVIGIELVESAVEDGRQSIEMNNLSNVHLIKNDMKFALNDDSMIREYGTPDVVILDPPRSGMDSKTITDILKLLPKKIIYVSCNPPIMARDLTMFCKDAYKVKIVQPVDMFPQTKHIEVVVLLERNNNNP
jgi:23S rRNA (uracil1939-C5)-methyltransferase